MAKRPIPKNLEKHVFKKGQSGNPLGSKLHNPLTKALMKLTITTYREVIEMVLTANIPALQEMVEDKDSTALQVGVARSFLKAIKEGNYEVIERIAERIIGKIPEQLNVSSTNLNANLNAEVSDDKIKAALLKLESGV